MCKNGKKKKKFPIVISNCAIILIEWQTLNRCSSAYLSRNIKSMLFINHFKSIVLQLNTWVGDDVMPKFSKKLLFNGDKGDYEVIYHIIKVKFLDSK